MTWKTVTTFVTDMALDGAALDAAAALAGANDAHLDVFCLGVDPTMPEVYYTGAQAIALPSAMEEASRLAQTLETAVRARLADSDLRWSVSAVSTPIIGVAATVSDAARFSDVVVTAQPYGTGRTTTQVQVVEAALFGGNAPVLVMPDTARSGPLARVTLAWNDSPEALRAARLALPVMQAADSVEIVVIDPPRHGPDRSDPGGRVAQMLARHGVHADIRILARTLPGISDTLARHLADNASDLLVMGAYGHSRLRESILGGATRDMLEHAAVPVLMVH